MGNFSRNTFDLLKNYVGVRLQQGVPILDADLNELEDIRRHELQGVLRSFIGDGVADESGFRISPAGSNTDFTIAAGRYLVDGREVVNHAELAYTDQPLFRNAELAARWGVPPLPPLTAPARGSEREDTVYLDAWEREVDADEDPDLVNPAIGIETSVRLKREWVVRVAEGAPTMPRAPEGHVHGPVATLTWAPSEPFGRSIESTRTSVPRLNQLTGLAQIRDDIRALQTQVAELADVRTRVERLERRLTPRLHTPTLRTGREEAIEFGTVPADRLLVLGRIRRPEDGGGSGGAYENFIGLVLGFASRDGNTQTGVGFRQGAEFPQWGEGAIWSSWNRGSRVNERNHELTVQWSATEVTLHLAPGGGGDRDRVYEANLAVWVL
ncbi:MAG: hypothetical protein H0U67_02245 [Gemmatimonadetes bacterium]|nr:hypothetical protein [Gemmatimonadota bacterium]